MKFKLLLALFLASFLNFAYADNHRPVSYGMEGYQCNFKDGKDIDDVIKFAEKSC